MDGRSWKSRVAGFHYRLAHVVFDISPQASRWRRRVMRLRGVSATFLNVPPRLSDSGALAPSDPGSEPLKLVFAGFIGRQACLDSLFRVIAVSHFDLECTVYGVLDHPEAQNLMELASELGLRDRVQFAALIPRESLFDALRQHHVGVALCRDTGNSYGSQYCCPNKLFEYAACGLAVLASSQESIVSWVEGNSIGKCVDPEDPEAIAEALGTLSNRSELVQMMANARQVHLEGWNIETQADHAWAAISEAACRRKSMFCRSRSSKGSHATGSDNLHTE